MNPMNERSSIKNKDFRLVRNISAYATLRKYCSCRSFAILLKSIAAPLWSLIKGLKAVFLLSLIIDSITAILCVDSKKLKVMSINT